MDDLSRQQESIMYLGHHFQVNNEKTWMKTIDTFKDDFKKDCMKLILVLPHNEDNPWDADINDLIEMVSNFGIQGQIFRAKTSGQSQSCFVTKASLTINLVQ